MQTDLALEEIEQTTLEEITMMKAPKINERGRRIGEPHPRAKLTAHEIALITELYAEVLSGRMTLEEMIGRFAQLQQAA